MFLLCKNATPRAICVMMSTLIVVLSFFRCFWKNSFRSPRSHRVIIIHMESIHDFTSKTSTMCRFDTFSFIMKWNFTASVLVSFAYFFNCNNGTIFCTTLVHRSKATMSQLLKKIYVVPKNIAQSPRR